MTQKNKDLGVAIGRFQIHELHEGHLHLLDTVYQKHEHMLILVGCNDVRINPADPYPFQVRQQMLQGKYPEATILSLFDSKVSHTHWSEMVDQKVAAVSHNNKAVLYGSRDSFIPFYTGNFSVEEMSELEGVSATKVREAISQQPVDDPLFRLGWLAAIKSQYPVTDATVDVAVVRSNFTEVLVGRRDKNAEHFRFIGGFKDSKDASYEAAAMRELSEEVLGIEAGSPTFLGSHKVDDNRYRDENYGIVTHFFVVEYQSGEAIGGDDMPHVEWRALDETLLVGLNPEHVPLAKMLLEYAKNQRSRAAA